MNDVEFVESTASVMLTLDGERYDAMRLVLQTRSWEILDLKLLYYPYWN